MGWSGEAYVRANAEAPMRTSDFGTTSGDGFVVYLVLALDRTDDLIQVVWYD